MPNPSRDSGRPVPAGPAINHFNHKPRQMPLRQPLIHRRGQQKPGLPIHVAKIAHPPPPLVPKPFHFTTLCAS
jgi:hypothetical protein